VTDCAHLKYEFGVHGSSKGVAYEIWVDVAYVFVRDVCHSVE
jgi:hypothetical protein